MSLKFKFEAEDVIREGRVFRKDVDTLKEWIMKNNLPRSTDEQLVLFLISCENDVDKAKDTILAFYDYKAQAPGMTNNRNLTSAEMIHQMSVIGSSSFPGRTRNNYMVILQRFKNTSYREFNFESSLKLLLMTLDLGLYQNPPPDGVICLFDMKGLGLMHLTRFRLTALRILLGFVQEALPVQVRGIHVFNSTYICEKLLAIMKPFMKAELLNMIYFHPPDMDMNEFFHKYLEADYIPTDYGGNLAPVEQLEQMTLEGFREMEDFFRIEEEMRADYKPSKK